MGLGSAGSSPVSSNISYDSYYYSLNHINLTIGKKIPQTTITYTKKTHQIIYLFYKLGCVNNFFIHFNSYGVQPVKLITFSIFFYKNSPFFKSVRLISSPARKYSITYKALKIASQSLGMSILVISTNKGLLTHHDALRARVGGFILAIIN